MFRPSGEAWIAMTSAPSYLFAPEEQVEAAKRVLAAIESGAYALDVDEDVDAPDDTPAS